MAAPTFDEIVAIKKYRCIFNKIWQYALHVALEIYLIETKLRGRVMHKSNNVKPLKLQYTSSNIIKSSIL